MTKSIMTHPSYNDIHTACVDVLAPAIDQLRFIPSKILGLSRGGLFPATILSHCLNDMKMVPVSYSSKSGRGDQRNHQNNLPRVSDHRSATLLLVDDICDSGKTLKEVYDHYTYSCGHIVYTAVLYYKRLEDGPIVPDLYWQEIPENAPWIIFPWENNKL